MKFYTTESAHGTESSFGFCNDHIVKVWASPADRDDYVDKTKSVNISVKPILKRECTRYATNNRKPNTFVGEYWGVSDASYTGDNNVKGYIGNVEIFNSGCDHNLLYRFYK
jgi:hypothetical protein